MSHAGGTAAFVGVSLELTVGLYAKRHVTNDPLVSADLNHISASATVALPQTQVIDGRLARVLAWYDNEWGFSTRMADVALALAAVA